MNGNTRIVTFESSPELENALKWITGSKSVKRPKVSKDLPHKHVHSSEHERIREDASSWAQLSPLIAATLGPLSILLGIPCLTQRWHGVVLDPQLLPNGWLNYQPLADPPLTIVLGSIMLVCEVTGNILLILRFSDFYVRATTWLSYGFWILKIVLGIANYVQFGIAHPQIDGIVYLEGYWVPPTRLL
jgi:hypothetical protein